MNPFLERQVSVGSRPLQQPITDDDGHRCSIGDAKSIYHRVLSGFSGIIFGSIVPKS
jgi:hypothetical protein